MKSISINIVKANRYEWQDDDTRGVICDDWVRKYIGRYKIQTYGKLTIKKSKNGLVRFQIRGIWVWTFDDYPDGSFCDWNDNQQTDHDMYYLLRDRISNLAENEMDFRADIYFEEYVKKGLTE